MKKLNITKKKFNESKYFQTKYGKLEYVSESGKLYKTTKGKVLKFNESEDTVTCAACENEVPASDVEYLEGQPLCSKCREGGVHESSYDIDNDPAYECPYCGGHNCEFEDCEDPGTQEGYFDGSKFMTTWWCADCEDSYDVEFTMNVTNVQGGVHSDIFDESSNDGLAQILAMLIKQAPKDQRDRIINMLEKQVSGEDAGKNAGERLRDADIPSGRRVSQDVEDIDYDT